MKYFLMITFLLSAPLATYAVMAPHQANQYKGTTMESNKAERIKTASGLEYEVLYTGSGAQPSKGNHVTVHYTGWLNANGEKGRKFDSSIERGRPFTFIIGVGQVIQGWDEGVLSMKIGEKRRLYIPARLGYGVAGYPPVIPANSDLIFDVELLSVG